MSSITRPGTPFPFMESPTHTRRQNSTSQHQPLHFPQRNLPSPTPPSLFQRTSSSGSASSTSRVHHSPTPSYFTSTPRRTSSSFSSSSCSSTFSPSIPITPILEANTPLPTPSYVASPLSLPQKLSLPEPEYNWRHKDLSTTSSLSHFHLDYDSQQSYPSSPVYTPTRPALKRRDTPRPPPREVEPMTRCEEKGKTVRKLTSVTDGQSWVVLA